MSDNKDDDTLICDSPRWVQDFLVFMIFLILCIGCGIIIYLISKAKAVTSIVKPISLWGKQMGTQLGTKFSTLGKQMLKMK